MIQFNYSQNLLFSDADMQQHQEEISKVYQQLTTKSGKGNDFLGWLDLPEETDEVLLNQIQSCANRLASVVHILVHVP